MVLARWQRPIIDAAGNLILSGNCEVRREDAIGTPLAPLYSDRAGATPLGNPFAFVNGLPAFHAIGGSYRVRVYGTGFDTTYNYQAVGTGAEVDSDSLLIPGYLYEFETATSEPPTAGCIRADNSDLSAADHLYISKTTVAGVDVGSRIAALALGQMLLTSTNAGQQVEFHVDSVTDDGTYYELAVSSQVGAISIPAGRVGLQKQGSTGPAGASGAIVGTEIIYTSASNSIGTAEAGKTLVANRATAIAFNLDAAATLGNTWMAIVRNIGAGALTCDPNGSELIEGASIFVLLPGESALITCTGTGFRVLLRSGDAPTPPQGRLTLTSGVAVTVSDVSGATSIYYSPASGDRCPIYDGIAWAMISFTELTLPLDSNSGHTGYQQSGKNFDLFVFKDAGTVRLGSGPAWSSDTARGTGAGTTELELKNGYWTNKNTATLRFGSSSGDTVAVAANQATYVGTFRAVASGQASDTLLKRFLWNAYNQAPRVLKATDGTTSWNYSTASVRQANANAANKVEMVVGLSGVEVEATAIANLSNSTSTARFVATAIGVDTVSSPGQTLNSNNQVQSAIVTLYALYEGYPGLGYHYLAWLEVGAGSDTQTWYGSGSGLKGKFFG